MLWKNKVRLHGHQVTVSHSNGTHCSICFDLGTVCKYSWYQRPQYKHGFAPRTFKQFLKELLRDLRSNLNEENADRVSKAVNNLNTIVQNFERKMEIKKQQSSHNKAKMSGEDVRNFWSRICLLKTPKKALL